MYSIHEEKPPQMLFFIDRTSFSSFFFLLFPRSLPDEDFFYIFLIIKC